MNSDKLLKSKEKGCAYSLKTVENWEQLSECTSENFQLEIDLHWGSGWIVQGETRIAYLSTHAFYESTHKQYEELLNKHGFNVKLKSWG